MLKADKSRRIMLSSAQAVMVRRVEAERKVVAFVARAKGCECECDTQGQE